MRGEVYRFELPEGEDPAQAPEINPEPVDNIFLLPQQDRPVELFDQAQMLTKKSRLAVEIVEKSGKFGKRNIKIIGPIAGVTIALGGIYAVRKKRKSR